MSAVPSAAVPSAPPARTSMSAGPAEGTSAAATTSSGSVPPSGKQDRSSKYLQRVKHQEKAQVRYRDPDETFDVTRGELHSFWCVRCTKSYEDPVSLRKHAVTCSQIPGAHSPRSTLSPALDPQMLTDTDLDESTLKEALRRDLITVPPHPFGEVIVIVSDSDTSDNEELEHLPLSKFDPSSVIHEPDEYTIINHLTINLPALGIIINTLLKCVICLHCSRAVEFTGIERHIHTHLKFVNIPDALSEDLGTEFGLVPLKEIGYFSAPIPPVFGIPIYEDPYYFCGKCHRGYQDYPTLRSHQSNKERCTVERKEKSFHVGYAQSITKGSRKRNFQVDIACLRSREEINYANLFEDEQNLGQFFYREKWASFVAGYTPEEIREACRGAMPDEPVGQALKAAANRYITNIQASIQDQQTYGFLKSESGYHFNHILKDAVTKYAGVLHCLLFSVIRSMDVKWSSKVRYPEMDGTQKAEFNTLIAALSTPDTAAIDKAFHKACYVLFAHQRHQYPASCGLDKFFSPVNAFVVYASVHEGGNFRKAGVITQTLAAIIYSIRTTMLFQTINISSREKISVFDAYPQVQQYLQDRQETPLSFIFNVYRLLATIRSSEANSEAFTFTDVNGREISHEGNLIRIDDIKRMIDGELVPFNEYLKREIFFGEDVAANLLPKFEIEDLVDNIQNHSTGYSFIEDERNGFGKYRFSYGRWLLSDPNRAHRFVYRHNGKLVWRTIPAFDLLKKLEHVRALLSAPLAASTGPTTRATEFARNLFRNSPGATRNVMILYHLLCIVAIQDKTSHRRLKDRFVPHTPTREWAMALIINLVFFRPFEEFLVGIFMDSDAIDRYRYQLWPGLKSTMTGEKFGELFGAMTEKYLGKSYSVQFWRNLLTAIGNRLPNARAFELHKEYFFDTVMMHSTDMSVLKYGRDTGQYSGSDYRVTKGCIEVCLSWHQHVNIGQKRPLKISSFDGDELPEVRQVSGDGGSVMPIGPAVISQISREVVRDVGAALEDRTREAVMNCMAEVVAAYFPKPRPPLDDNILRAISDVSVHPSRLKDLRVFLKSPTADFSCAEQGVLLELMIQGKQSILGILGTGTGKTTVVMMHAKMYGKGRVTVIILPLSGLHADLERRAHAFSVSLSRWVPSGKFNPDVNIVYVSIEHLGFDGFQSYLKNLELTGRLHIIVFDEIHKVMTDQGYRDSFGDFCVLNSVKTIIVGLTGSLPPHAINAFTDLTKTTWRIIRTPSTCRELCYEVRRVPKKQTVQAIVKDLSVRVAGYSEKDRAMVFCRSHNASEMLAVEFKVKPYTSATVDTNPATMEAWLEGRSKVMVSTSILGCGLDYPNVRDVIHVDVAYTMIDQYQQESRGGRDGLPCRVITYVPEERQASPEMDLDDIFGRKEVYEWSMNTDQCLRILQSLYLDGVAVSCLFLPGCTLCAYCQQQVDTEAPLEPRNVPTTSTSKSAGKSSITLLRAQPKPRQTEDRPTKPRQTEDRPTKPPPAPVHTTWMPRPDSVNKVTGPAQPPPVPVATKTPGPTKPRPVAATNSGPTKPRPVAATNSGPTKPPPVTATSVSRSESSKRRKTVQETGTAPISTAMPAPTRSHSSHKRKGVQEDQQTASNKHPRLSQDHLSSTQSQGSLSTLRRTPSDTDWVTFTYDRTVDGKKKVVARRVGSSDQSSSIEIMSTTPPTDGQEPSTPMILSAMPSTGRPGASTPMTLSTMSSTGRPGPSTSETDHESKRRQPVIPRDRAGLWGRVDQKITEDDARKYEDEVIVPFRRAFNQLRGYCVICRLIGSNQWQEHLYEDCPTGYGVNRDDYQFRAFKKAFFYDTGWCFDCGIHQKDQKHRPRVQHEPCPDRGIFIRVLYAYKFLDISELEGWEHEPSKDVLAVGLGL
ncbi:hypothetical protein BDZ97DRAFT_1930113 [Flammula alnicola]|nr:hypothetical protein BDZ97DRAFT_1930113 [Flammula alnicola]